MTERGYKEAKKKLPLLRPKAAKALYDFLEALITVKGHAWCMDVKSERKKMSRLLTKALIGL